MLVRIWNFCTVIFWSTLLSIKMWKLHVIEMELLTTNQLNWFVIEESCHLFQHMSYVPKENSHGLCACLRGVSSLLLKRVKLFNTLYRMCDKKGWSYQNKTNLPLECIEGYIDRSYICFVNFFGLHVHHRHFSFIKKERSIRRPIYEKESGFPALILN